MVARVDVVGPYLEAGNLPPCSNQRTHQSGGNRGLTVARAGGGNHQAGELVRGPGRWRIHHHSMPRWPFCPSSKGCLILVISVTSWAAASSFGSARRPVMITCW